MNDDLERVRAIRERVAADLRLLPNVTGVGVGYKYVGKRRTGQIAITVYVKKKVPPAELDSLQRIPSEIDGVPTDVIEVGTVKAGSLGSPGSVRFPKLIGGIEVTHAARRIYIVDGEPVLGRMVGTLSAVFVHRKTRQAVALSNWHVFPGAPGDEVTQPATGDFEDVIGRIHKSAFAPSLGVDAAIAILNSPRDYSEGEVRGVGRVRGFAAPQLGASMVKSGLTTGVTGGEIVAVDVEQEVTYETEGMGTPTMHHLIKLEGTSRHGDSGAIWLDSDLRAVGLNVAGNDEFAWACPMLTVAAVLDLDVGFDPVATQYTLSL